MVKNKLQGWEPFIIQCVAVLISSLYILSPLKEEVSNIVYVLGHVFQAPKTILSHKSMDNEITVFNSKQHQIKIQKHNHEVSDFICELFKKSNTDEGQSPIQKTTKIDKHITYHTIILECIVDLKIKKHTFFYRKQKMRKGFLAPIKDPPDGLFS